MSRFTVDDVMRILRTVAGADDQADRTGKDATDIPFSDLGYDSLAVLELVGRIEREYGIEIPDGELGHEGTPREVTDYVNSRLAEATL